jgi:hypothetical protein
LRNNAIFWSENLKGRDGCKELTFHERVILEWILEKYIGYLWAGFMCLRIGTNIAGCSEVGNRPSGSIQGAEFREQLDDY